MQLLPQCTISTSDWEADTLATAASEQARIVDADPLDVTCTHGGWRLGLQSISCVVTLEFQFRTLEFVFGACILIRGEVQATPETLLEYGPRC